jgi:predicted nucleotidyltransferase
VEKLVAIGDDAARKRPGDHRRMASALTFPPVTDQLLEEVVRRILTIGSPVKIVLFGSHAKGTARPDSDLDLLIIEESDLPRYRRSGRYRRVLCGVFPAKDIVVWTPEEVDEWKALPDAFISTALAEGKLLYER